MSAVIDAVATADLFSLVSLLSMPPLVAVIGNLKCLLLGWLGSWLAGWLAAWPLCWPGLLVSGGWRLCLRWPAFIFECGPCWQVALQGPQVQFLLARC